MKEAVPLVKNILAPLGITAAVSAIDAGIQKKKKKKKKMVQESGTTTLISNEEMNDIMKIVQALEDSNVLLKGSLKQLKTKRKNKKEDF